MSQHEEQQMRNRQKKKKKTVPVLDIKRNLSQLVWDLLWHAEPTSLWDLGKTLTMRNVITVDSPPRRASGPSGDCSVGKTRPALQPGGRSTGVAITRLQEDASGKGKRRPWPSATVTLRNEGWTWEDPSHHSPHQGGLLEGLMLPPAQLQAHQAQRQ